MMAHSVPPEMYERRGLCGGWHGAAAGPRGVCAAFRAGGDRNGRAARLGIMGQRLRQHIAPTADPTFDRAGGAAAGDGRFQLLIAKDAHHHQRFALHIRQLGNGLDQFGHGDGMVLSWFF